MEEIISNINIVLYISVLLFTTILYQKKRGYFDSGSVLLFSYLLYSIMSLLLYNNPFFVSIFQPIRLFPFIYLYSMLILTALPIFRYDQSKIREIQMPSVGLLKVFSVVFIITSLVQLPAIISDFKDSIVELLTVSSGGQDLYNESIDNSYSTGDGSIANLAAILSNSYGYFGILLFFYYLTIENRNKFILIGLFLSIIIGIFTYISLGQRGPIVEMLFSMIITYFALKKFMTPKVNKIIKIVGVSLIAMVSVPIIALTNSRFEDNLGSLSSVYYYVGQENLYFNNYGLDNGGIRYGDRTFPFFKRMLGFENIPNNFWERREKYPDLEINDEVFIGFIGDFTLDFGPVPATLILIIFTLIVLRKTRIWDGEILFHQLILIHFVMSVCMVGGMKLYPFSDTGGNLQLIFYFLAYLIFKADYLITQHKKTNVIF
ncbi:MAG: O-antigen ligase [Paludibacter sp.]|jgi:oligosaccharide repeat unit polymerase|nr:O-antigen ligase [Paludibacter sp.]